ncbi:MAG: class I SAM-dependent methyltransferase [Nitrospinota bacterium]
MNLPSLPIDKFEAIYTEWEGEADLGEDVRRHLAERGRYHRMLDRVLSAIPRDSLALELGCGTGIDSCILSKRHPHVRFAGIDIVQGSLNLARRESEQTGEEMALLQGDVSCLPFRSASIPLIFHQGLVEHFRDPAGMMREQERVLMPGGWAFISVPQTWTGYTVMKRRRIRAGTWPWGWERSFTAGAIGALGRRAGLEPVETQGEGYWHSCGEPAWVLRDLYAKFHRRYPAAGRAPVAPLGRAWEALWARAEEALDHRFCKNVIVSFQKPLRGGGD